MDKVISVIIPSYNRKELTDLAVESVVTSSPDLVEIIVVDDCSSVEYAFKDTNSSGVPVHVIRLKSNVGPGMARKEGVSRAEGKYIAFLDSDDCYDEEWIDHISNLLRVNSELSNRRVFISGITRGERPVGAFVRRVLASVPTRFQLVASRLVATMFNPFCTPSIVLSRNLCFFKEGLRHCEDYYTTAFGLFGAEKILLPQVVACHLGRDPNSAGGETAAKGKMFRGEMRMRREMMTDARVPIGYKLFVPLGILYQWCRTIAKRIFTWEE